MRICTCTTLVALYTILQFFDVFENSNSSSVADVPAIDVSSPTYQTESSKKTENSPKMASDQDRNFRRNEQILCSRTKGHHADTSDFDDIFRTYWRYEKIEKYLKYIAQNYPNTTTLTKIGMTYENRTLYVLTKGFGLKNNNVVFVCAGMHAREWSSVMMALYIIFGLVECQMYPSSTIHYLDWMILPVVNPDGYEYSLSTDKRSRVWRKNRSPCPEQETCNGTQGCGVDLNKNFPFMFSGIGGSVNPCSNIYTGDKPCSEEESKAMVEILKSIKPQLKLYLDLHSYGGVILYPYSNNKAPSEDQDELIRLAQLYTNQVNEIIKSKNLKYRYGNYAEIQNPSSGSALDYVRGGLKVPYVYIIRLLQDMGQKEGFYVRPKKALQIVAQGFLGIKAMAEDVYSNNPPAKSFLRQKLGYRRRRRNRGLTKHISYPLFVLLICIVNIVLAA